MPIPVAVLSDNSAQGAGYISIKAFQPGVADSVVVQLLKTPGFLLASASAVTSSTAAIATITAGSPIVVTTPLAHGLQSGAVILLTGATGITAANGQWVITTLSSTTFALVGSTGSGTYGASSGSYVVLSTSAQASAYAAGIRGQGVGAGTTAAAAFAAAILTLGGVTLPTGGSGTLYTTSAAASLPSLPGPLPDGTPPQCLLSLWPSTLANYIALGGV